MVSHLKKKDIAILVALIGLIGVLIQPITEDLWKSWADKPEIEVYVSYDVVPEHMNAGNFYKLDFKVKNIGEKTAILRSIEIEVLDFDNYTPVLERVLSNTELESENYVPLLKRGLEKNRESKNNKNSYLLKNEGLGPALNLSVVGTNVYESGSYLEDGNFNESSYVRFHEPSNLTQKLGILFNETLWKGNLSEGDVVEIQHSFFNNITIYPEEAIDFDFFEKNSTTVYSFYDKVEYYDLYGSKQIKYAAYYFIEMNGTFYGPCLGGESMGILNTSSYYDGFVTTNKKCPYVEEIPISHYLEPNEADRWSLTLNSDSTAAFKVKIYLIYDDQKLLVSNKKLSFVKDHTVSRSENGFLSLLDQEYWY